MNQYKKYWVYTSAPVLLILIITGLTFDFIEQTIRNHPELNLMILAVIALSVGMVLFRQYNLWNEALVFESYRAVYEKTGDLTSADVYLESQKAHVKDVLKIIGKLDGRIERTIDQQVVAQEMDALKEHFSANLSLPNFMGGFMVALGLFGTFVGLLETLKSSGELLAGFSSAGNADLEGAVTGMLVGMKGPLNGMATAFSASLFGLLGSLLIGIMVNTCQSMGRHIEHEVRIFIGRVVTLSDAPATGVSAPATPVSDLYLREQLSRVMAQQSAALDLFDQSRQADLELKQFFYSIARDLRERTDMVERSLGVQEQMFLVAQEQSRQTGLFLEQMSRMTALGEQFNSQTLMLERTTRSLEHIAGQVHENVQLSGALIKSVSHAQGQMDERQDKLFAAALDAIGAYHHSLTEHQQRLIGALKDMSNHLGTEVIQIDQRQTQQTAQLIALQSQTTEILQLWADRRKPDTAQPDVSIEVVRDIRKNRELLQMDLAAEFGELKRMIHSIIKRNTA